MPIDPRKVVGNVVIAKAIHVRNETWCRGRYGSLIKTAEVQGIFTNVEKVKKSDNGAAQTYVTAIFELGDDDNKLVRLHLTNLKTGISLIGQEMIETAIPVAAVLADFNASIVANNKNNNDTPEDNIDDGKQASVPDDILMVRQAAARACATLGITPIRNDNNFNTNDMIGDGVSPSAAPPAATRLFVDDDDATVQPEAAVIQAHDKLWYHMPHASQRPLNGPIPPRDWGLKLPTEQVWKDGCNYDSSISRLDVFLQMYPTAALNIMHQATNDNIKRNSNNNMTATKQELLKFIGIIILSTKYDWNDRSNLWSTTNASKYEMAPNFGEKTGMSRNRFDLLWKLMRYSHQPPERPEGMNSETYRWMLVQDFVDAINTHRALWYYVTDRICVDESFSRWYGQGGFWINHGLPMYVSYERKPDDGCEIWTCCDGRTGIMIRLILVKSSEEQEAEREMNTEQQEEQMNHGTRVLLDLVQPWFNSNRVVCADSYFSLVQTAIKCKEKGLKYIGVVKTATKQYPMAHLGKLELKDKGDRYAMAARDENGHQELLAFVWRDRERRYFIASGSSMDEGTPISRERWRQTTKDKTTPPEKQNIIIPQPKATEIYYDVCGKIDQHNRDRQATLGLERKLKTHDWSKRVNLTLLSMCIVDSWKVWNLISKTNEGEAKETQKAFYAHLAAELIDNQYDGIRIQRNATEESPELNNIRNPRTGEVRMGLDIHLTPTKRQRKCNGDFTTHKYAGRCIVCKI